MGFALDIAFSGRARYRTRSRPALVIATGTQFRGEDWLDRVSRMRDGSWRRAASTSVQPRSANRMRNWARMSPDRRRRQRVRRRPHPAAQRRAGDDRHALEDTAGAAALVAQSAALHPANGRAEVIAGRTVAALDDAGGRDRVATRRRPQVRRRPRRSAVRLPARTRTSHGSRKLALRQDADGHLVVDGNMETSCPGVFAVGDVANPTHPCVATAIASGTMAARRIQQRLAPRNEPASGRGSG